VNTADLRSVFFVGPEDGWRLVLVPEVLTYLGGAGDIAEYRGYGQLAGRSARRTARFSRSRQRREKASITAPSNSI
jgi:hypothetical protein